MPNHTNTPICTVIIPAYNEAAVIGKTLKALLKSTKDNEFDIIVVCNGCYDNTANIARSTAPTAKVLETEIASKANALNMGIKAAKTFPIAFLDADIIVSPASVRSLIHRLNWSDAFLAYGSAKFQTQNSNWAVSAFYGAWKLNPYFDQHKVGGFFAISKTGIEALESFPETLNDDEYVRRSLQHNSTWVETAAYKVEPPRDLTNLIKVRSRVYRGNKLLEKGVVPLGEQKRKNNAVLFLTRILTTPAKWPGAVIFAFTAFAAHSRNYLNAAKTPVWESDASTRKLLSK